MPMRMCASICAEKRHLFVKRLLQQISSFVVINVEVKWIQPFFILKVNKTSDLKLLLLLLL